MAQSPPAPGSCRPPLPLRLDVAFSKSTSAGQTSLSDTTAAPQPSNQAGQQNNNTNSPNSGRRTTTAYETEQKMVSWERDDQDESRQNRDSRTDLPGRSPRLLWLSRGGGTDDKSAVIPLTPGERITPLVSFPLVRTALIFTVPPCVQLSASRGAEACRDSRPETGGKKPFP